MTMELHTGSIKIQDAFELEWQAVYIPHHCLSSAWGSIAGQYMVGMIWVGTNIIAP